MKGPSRRSFVRQSLAAACGAGAAAVTQWTGCSAPSRQPVPIEGAPGVEFLSSALQPSDYSQDLPRYLARVAAGARSARLLALAAIRTKEQVLERQRLVRQEVWRMLGAGPYEKSPLNVRVTGVIERPGYRVEKLMYESRPRFIVTANLYVPAARGGALPAVISPLGHEANGKAAAGYQKLFINLARLGYVVLAYDSAGQGERIEYPGFKPGESLLGGPTAEHERAGRRLILLGVNFALFPVWDGMRGLDYLLSRPEVDPARIACCGQSGGGTITQYLACLDDRIRVAVDCQGNVEDVAEANVEPPGSIDDAEQNLVPSLARGIDRSDLLYCFAPRPLLVQVSTHDAGDTYSPEYISSAIGIAQDLRQAYGLLGAGDRLRVEGTFARHSYDLEMRLGTYRWLNRWLRAGEEIQEEPETPVEADGELLATEAGFAAKMPGVETTLTLTRSMTAAIPQTKGQPPKDLNERIRRVLAIPEVRSDLGARTLARAAKRNYRVESFEYSSEAGLRIPGYLLEPQQAATSTATVLYLAEAAAITSISEGSIGEQLCAVRGLRVCAIDMRGRGDAAMAYPARGARYFSYRMNENYLNWFTLSLGRPLFGGYVWDALRALEFLRAQPQVAKDRIWLAADGPHGLAALFALALDPSVRGAILHQCLTGYRPLAASDYFTQPFSIFLFGVLKEFDLPDLAAACAPRPLLLLDPAGPDGQPAASDEAIGMYEGARRAYEGKGQSSRFLIAAKGSAETLADWIFRWTQAN